MSSIDTTTSVPRSKIMSQTTTEPCCDMPANASRQVFNHLGRLSSPIASLPSNESTTKSTNTIPSLKSSKLIETIIETIHARHLLAQVDPLKSNRTHNFRLSPLSKFLALVNKILIFLLHLSIPKYRFACNNARSQACRGSRWLQTTMGSFAASTLKLDPPSLSIARFN